MSRDTKHHFEFSAVRIAGLILIVMGIIFIAAFGRGLIRTEDEQDVSDKSGEYDELFDEALKDEKNVKDHELSGSDRNALPMLILGALMISAGVPMFYRPYTDKGMRLRRKLRKRKEKVPEKDAEFDYPDDDYDFIIRREIYEMLHKEQLENIRRKHNRK